jgi:hypothetical protein
VQSDCLGVLLIPKLNALPNADRYQFPASKFLSFSLVYVSCSPSLMRWLICWLQRVTESVALSIFLTVFLVTYIQHLGKQLSNCRDSVTSLRQVTL